MKVYTVSEEGQYTVSGDVMADSADEAERSFEGFSASAEEFELVHYATTWGIELNEQKTAENICSRAASDLAPPAPRQLSLAYESSPVEHEWYWTLARCTREAELTEDEQKEVAGALARLHEERGWRELSGLEEAQDA